MRLVQVSPSCFHVGGASHHVVKMRNRELPVLSFSSFRRYPTKLAEQAFQDEVGVCNRCVSGVCCVNQDAIALSSFDIFRLSAFFDMSPAQFMLTFTQDEFGDDDDGEFRRYWNTKSDSSVVTWLRRRANLASSPCIFLKYIREADGTPRRVCSVHDARPLSCREYYFAHCKTRGTGELAALLAEGFEKVRDGEITDDIVERELARFTEHDFAKSSLSENTEYGFWVELKCALHMGEANCEGSNSYDISKYQDPIDDKLNRVLSSKYLRSEESYGWKPRDEQLMPYTSGLSFAGSPEYERLLQIARSPPTSYLFARRHYPYYVALRTMMRGVVPSGFFPEIPRSEIDEFLGSLPDVNLFAQHPQEEVRSITLRDSCAAVLKSYNYILRFGSHIASLEPILESDPPGTIELELFKIAVDMETGFHQFVANNQYLEQLKLHAAPRALQMVKGHLEKAVSDRDIFECFKLLAVFLQTRWKMPQGLRARVKEITAAVDKRLEKAEIERYLDLENPIAERRRAGKRMDLKTAYGAWAHWYSTIDDIYFASLAGFKGLNLSGFYENAVNELEQLEFRESYATCLFDVIKYLARSMSANNRMADQDMPFRKAADRLASYGTDLFNWQRTQSDPAEDYELLANFAVAQRNLGCGLKDENLGSIIHRILETQLPDGSWKTDLPGEETPDCQAEFLEQMYRPTWSCTNALRLTRDDLSNANNDGHRHHLSAS